MPDKPVTLIARIHAKPGKEDETREELEALLEPTRAETGCINYDMHLSADDPALFMFHENWTDRQALDQHRATPHLKAFMEKESQLLAKPVDITLWEKTN